MIQEMISVLTFLFIVILCGELRKWFIQRKLRNFQSVKQTPILGIAGRFLKKSDDESIRVFLDIFSEVKSPFRMWLGPILGIGLSEPEDIQVVLTSDDCLNRPYLANFFHSISSIFSTDRKIWKPHRRALNAAFNPKVLQKFVPILDNQSRILVKEFEPFLNKPGDLYRKIFIGMMDMAGNTLMGLEMNAQADRGPFFYKLISSVTSGVQYRLFRFWFHLDWTYYKLSKIGREELHCVREGNKYFDEMYERKVEELRLLKSKGIDHLDNVKKQNATNFLEKCLILEREGTFTHENVLDQMRFFTIASLDTSAFAVFATLLMLAINQKHQEMVVEELHSIFDSADCDVTQDHLTGMHYLERVIKETMRLFPPIPLFIRKSSADIKLSKGTIPKDAFIFINILYLHRKPEIWGENVTEFDPDRFLPENIAKRAPFSYIPFSGGSRNCIGMKYAMISAKIILANLLRRYKFTTDLKFEDIRIRAHIVLEVTNKNALQIEDRHF